MSIQFQGVGKIHLYKTCQLSRKTLPNHIKMEVWEDNPEYSFIKHWRNGMPSREVKRILSEDFDLDLIVLDLSYPEDFDLDLIVLDLSYPAKESSHA